VAYLGEPAAVTLREQVDRLLPGWESWYPSLFDAARDLGVIRARVCDPSTLLLSNRHSRVRQRAEHAHVEQWGGFDDGGGDGKRKKRKRRK
jgi:hypothetical protein